MNKGKIIFAAGAIITGIYGLYLSYIGWSGNNAVDGWENNLYGFLGNIVFLLTIFFVIILVGLTLSTKEKC